jgi:hypothetical protein
MNPEYTIHAAQYFTATIYEWQTFLADDNHKNIIIDTVPEEYHYSSARFYYDGTNSFGMLKHYSGN